MQSYALYPFYHNSVSSACVGDAECDAGVTSVCQEFLVECSGPLDDRIKSADLLWQQFHHFGDVKAQRYDVCGVYVCVCVCVWIHVLYLYACVHLHLCIL